MVEPRDFAEPGPSIETLIRSAGNYVRPSDDLRPRVLESARAKSVQQQAARRFWQLAALVLICGSVATSFMPEREAVSTYPTVTAAGEFIAGADAAARSSDAGWQMVESFTQLRLRQAQLLRM